MLKIPNAHGFNTADLILLPLKIAVPSFPPTDFTSHQYTWDSGSISPSTNYNF